MLVTHLIYIKTYPVAKNKQKFATKNNLFGVNPRVETIKITCSTANPLEDYHFYDVAHNDCTPCICKQKSSCFFDNGYYLGKAFLLAFLDFKGL